MAQVPYSSVVRSLMYAMVCTCLGISQTISMVNKHMSCPGKVHWYVMKWILRYLCSISNTCLEFRRNGNILVGLVYSDYIRGLDKRRSFTSHVFYIGGCVVS